MQQRPEKFKRADGDPEATLVAPRFDDEEARRAHPVVPLAAAGAHAPNAYARRGPRRSWSTALLAVALLAVAAVGGAGASMFMRRAPSTPAAAQEPAAVAPTQAAEVPAQVEQQPQQPAVATSRELTREVADTKPEPRAPREPQARREEVAPVRARDEDARDDRKDFEGEDRRDREREKEHGRRRGRGKEDDGEKEMRKVQKRAKDKAPRLVDVLVHPGN